MGGVGAPAQCAWGVLHWCMPHALEKAAQWRKCVRVWECVLDLGQRLLQHRLDTAQPRTWCATQVLVVVPTRARVSQQASYCRRYCTPSAARVAAGNAPRIVLTSVSSPRKPPMTDTGTATLSARVATQPAIPKAGVRYPDDCNPIEVAVVRKGALAMPYCVPPGFVCLGSGP